MGEAENVLPQKTEIALVGYIFDWRFMLEITVAVVLHVLYSLFSSNLESILYTKMPSISSATALVMFFDFLLTVLILVIVFFIEKRETRKNLYLALFILIFFAVLNGASNWLTVGTTQTFKNFLNYARVFTNLSFAGLFITTVQVVKILENEKSFYGLLLMNYVLIILGLFVANPVVIHLLQNTNGQYLAPFVYFLDAALAYFLFAYIPYFLSVNSFWKGVYHGFIYSFKKFLITLALSASAAFINYFLFTLVGNKLNSEFFYRILYFLNLFVLAVFFIITTHIAKVELDGATNEEAELNKIEETE